MTNWKYTDSTNKVVFRVHDDGRMDSMLASALPPDTVIEPADPLPEPGNPPPPVTSVAMRQARLALLGAGLLGQVSSAIAAIPDATQRAAAEIEWEYATEVLRDSPWVLQLSNALGLDDDQLDKLFTIASAL